jgi:hypothetical protein
MARTQQGGRERALQAVRAVHTGNDVDAAVEAFLEELFWMSRALIIRQ